MEDQVYHVEIVRNYSDLEGMFVALLKVAGVLTHPSSVPIDEWYDWALYQLAHEVYGPWFERHDLVEDDDWWVVVSDAAEAYNTDCLNFTFCFDFHFTDSRMAVLFKLQQG